MPWLVGLWLCRQTACVQPAQLHPSASPSLLSLSGEEVMKARSKDFPRSNEMHLVSHGGCKGTLPPPAPQPGLLVPLAPSLGLSSVFSVSRELAQAGRGGRGRPPPVPRDRALEARLQPRSARTGAQPAATLPRPVAPGPVETLGSDALLTADTRYLDAFKPETRSGIKPHLPLQPGLRSRQPWRG